MEHEFNIKGICKKCGCSITAFQFFKFPCKPDVPEIDSAPLKRISQASAITPVSAKVFISHSHRDRAVATNIQSVITKFGAQTFLDQDKIQVADVLPDRIQQGIEWCDTFLLIWSSCAAASNWVDMELNTAYELRRKIIPYCLDSTSLPPFLENLVYVDRKDSQVAHVGLLRAVFGKDFSPPSTDIFPGRWRITLNAFGLGTATHDLELRTNGQVTGTGKIDQVGVIGDLMKSIGASDLLNLRPSVSGTWEYEEHTEILTLDLVAHGLGQEFPEKIQIRTTGREVGEIQGKDLSGRTYAMRRLPGYALKESLLDLERTLAHFAAAEITTATIGQEVELVIASVEAFKKHRTELSQFGDADLIEHFDKICESFLKLKEMVESDMKFSVKKLGLKLLAESMVKQILPEFVNECFVEA